MSHGCSPLSSGSSVSAQPVAQDEQTNLLPEIRTHSWYLICQRDASCRLPSRKETCRVNAFMVSSVRRDLCSASTESLEACRCKIVADCCEKTYGCRHCHDDEEDHHLEPKNVTQIVCMICSTKQPITGESLLTAPFNCSGSGGSIYEPYQYSVSCCN